MLRVGRGPRFHFSPVERDARLLQIAMRAWTRSVFGSVLVLFLSAGPSAAGPDPQQQQQSPSTSPPRSADFLFGRPRGAVGFRSSWVFQSAGSDIFDFVSRHLTLDKNDFDSPAFAGDVAIGLTSRLELQGGIEWSRVSRESEYRDYVDNRLQPIEQTTELNAISLAGSVRYSLTPKGRAISRLAWIPSRFVPYVGAGGGILHYEFRQFGDFVDFQDLSVFPESFRSSGWTPTAHVFGGADIRLYRALYATVQGRFMTAAGDLGSDFVDFDPIDLSGFRLSAGVNVLF